MALGLPESGEKVINLQESWEGIRSQCLNKTTCRDVASGITL
jgi:hypothetical protein